MNIIMLLIFICMFGLWVYDFDLGDAYPRFIQMDDLDVIGEDRLVPRDDLGWLPRLQVNRHWRWAVGDSRRFFIWIIHYIYLQSIHERVKRSNKKKTSMRRRMNLPKTSMVKLQEAVKSDTGERTLKTMVCNPTSSSPPSCLAHAGSESTYLVQRYFQLIEWNTLRLIQE